MKRTPNKPSHRSFDTVRRIGLRLPNVEATTKYDGSPMLKAAGCFMAGLAIHPSAEPDTLVVRAEIDNRELLLDEAPDTYYLTDHYRPHPVVLARLSRLDRDALRDLLMVSWRLTMAKRDAGPAIRDPRSAIRDE